jgi:ATP-dependent helicase/nuclease subunit B
MGNWLKNVELAFPAESLPLREWLPILETGLAGLTVGVIPPALDQVVIGALDRSRDSDLKLVIVLGLDETIFPALPEGSVLLSEGDRAALEKRNVILSSSAQQQLGRERYYAYVACTRARERLVLTRAVNNADGSPLNPSPFLLQVKQLFPSLRIENVPAERDWRKSEHAHELIVPMLRIMGEEQRGSNLNEAGAQPQPAKGGGPKGLSISTFRLPAPLQRLMGQLRQYRNLQPDEPLSPALAAQLYGPILQTSVSRMEQYAACPFRFFVNSGLRAEERKLFELDVREQGSFQHDVLACFHEQLCREKKRWRDITPAEARERVGKLAAGLLASYREGLLQATEQSRFMARVMTESLQDFAETLVGWMRDQYRFDPAAVELAFGAGGGLPSWELGLGAGQRLALNGRIDRVDICPIPGGNDAWCVVLDYKSSAKKLDDILMENGLQLQLLTYLNVARRRPASEALFGVKRLLPAGVFYVNLRGTYASAANRDQALADMESDRKMAYRHAGRFDDRVLRQLDARPEAQVGDQFNYRLTKKGVISQSNREALPATKFEALLDSVESNLKRMGEEIFSGKATVAPYRNGTKTACDQCSYEAICRIDPWIQRFRVLKSTS